MPISIERLNGEFLLHYSEFSFFVNRNGWRARPDWLISWEGKPVSFALSHPYLLAFDPSFIEIRHLETSVLVHIVTGKNIRMLHSSTREVFLPNRPFTISLQCLITVLRSYTPTKKTTAKTSSQASTSGPSPSRNNTSSRPRKPPLCALSPSPKTRTSASRASRGPGQPNPGPKSPFSVFLVFTFRPSICCYDAIYKRGILFTAIGYLNSRDGVFSAFLACVS